MTVSPTLPHAVALIPAACKIAAVISTVVVLPLVPVTAIHFWPGARDERSFHAISISLRSSSELLRIFTTKG